MRTLTLRAPLEKPRLGPPCLLNGWQKQESEVPKPPTAENLRAAAASSDIQRGSAS
jgi:hypothetical protein